MIRTCPDCLNELSFREMNGGRFVCECHGDDCRAITTTGDTAEEAGDKFVQKCEQFGWIRGGAEAAGRRISAATTSIQTSLRYIETVRCLPVGKWRTTKQVHDDLAARGFKVSKRTVERDLLKLARPFGIDLVDLRATSTNVPAG